MIRLLTDVRLLDMVVLRMRGHVNDPRPHTWRLPFMSDPDIPDKIVPAIRWAIVVIVLFVLALGISDTLREGKYTGAGIYSVLFLLTFVVAVKWHWMADRWHYIARFFGSRRATMFYIALAVVCALGLGIAVGKLMGRTSDAATTLVTSTALDTGRIAWNFDQIAKGQANFLNLGRRNQEEIRVLGFGAHGKNTSKDPVTEFRGVVRSDLTNNTLPIFIMSENVDAPAHNPLNPQFIPTRPEETYGIPGLAEFDIVSHEQALPQTGIDGMLLSRFQREFGSFTVVLEYDGIKLEQKFSNEDINKAVEKFRNDTNPQPTGAIPRVTRKPNATPPIQLVLPIPDQPAPHDQPR
jgi:hypothetical protein